MKVLSPSTQLVSHTHPWILKNPVKMTSYFIALFSVTLDFAVFVNSNIQLNLE